MRRFSILFLLLAALVAPPATADDHGAGTAQLQLVEATIPELQHAMQTKLLTAEQLVQMYLARIAAYDKNGPGVNAFLFVNPNAEAEAQQIMLQLPAIPDLPRSFPVGPTSTPSRPPAAWPATVQMAFFS